jgi:hypothetical protein
MFDTLPADEQMADIGGTEYPVEVGALSKLSDPKLITMGSLLIGRSASMTSTSQVPAMPLFSSLAFCSSG